MTPKTKAVRMLDTSRTALKKNQRCQFTGCLFSEQSINTERPGSVSTGGTDVNVPPEHDQKRFATLAAQFAIAGHALVRSSPAEGATAFYAMRWGCIKPLANLDACERFLNFIEGDRNVAD
ncbi:hypothetical protein [Variovorax sp. Root318D1]|uniref:hypothetical protein n=1 Tax=Variovorax sp. Root318D1 TaxID=1736513 RepID=UPI000B2AE3E3|nr:hypothetical protein [Variovorax sp. Root318D1]